MAFFGVVSRGNLEHLVTSDFDLISLTDEGCGIYDVTGDGVFVP